MTKRENVMKGLKICVQCRSSKDCDGCPYEGERTYAVPCGHVLMADALALLKEQEARVLTLDETIASCENPVWLEENTLQGSYGAWGVVKSLHEKYNAVNIGGVRFGYWPRAKYNISWRCWSARPTEEQMRDTPWEVTEDAE